VDKDIVIAAQTIRPYLSALAGEEAAAYDREIAGLLARARDGHDVSEELLAVLTRSRTMHAWAARVIADERHLPPEIVQALERGYQALPGKGGMIDAEKFACRYGDFVWFRSRSGSPFPTVPLPVMTARSWPLKERRRPWQISGARSARSLRSGGPRSRYPRWCSGWAGSSPG
jgi:hypothetical protein